MSAAKNAALPALCAALLTSEPVVLENVPALADVATTRALLERLGAEITTDPDGATRVRVTPRSRATRRPTSSSRPCARPCSSSGPLLARAGVARVSLPGGCAIGVRPIDQHLKGLPEARRRHRDPERLRGGAGEPAQGRADHDRSRDGHGHREPDDGGRPRRGHDGARERRARARGRGPGAAPRRRWARASTARARSGSRSRACPSSAARATGSSRTASRRARSSWRGPSPAATSPSPARRRATSPRRSPSWRSAGPPSPSTGTACGARGRSARTRPTSITSPFPGFPTDMQAQMMALLGLADGLVVITETIFENRFMHAAELHRMGARIETDGVDARWSAACRATRAPRSWPPTSAPPPRSCSRAWRRTGRPRSPASITSTAATSGSR